MELFPDLEIGWLNGWLVIILLALTDGIIFLIFPKNVVRRLFDRSGWSQKQQAFTVIGKMCALVCLVLLTLTPFKIGSLIFMVGVILTVLSLFGLVKALFDFKNTPLDKPVTQGLYRFSRHPQIVMSSLVLLGGCFAIGSWVAVVFWAVARLMEHFGIVAEEEVCFKQYGEAYRTYLKQVPRYFMLF
jgi:protein-S-isoprenylcysteine O-methyltransferase Ste14